MPDSYLLGFILIILRFYVVCASYTERQKEGILFFLIRHDAINTKTTTIRPITIMARLSVERRTEIITLHKIGWNEVDIANNVHCSQSCVSKVIKRFGQYQSVEDRPQSGRPRCTTPREDSYMLLQVNKNRFISLPKLHASLPSHIRNKVSRKTIGRRLREAGMKARVARKKPKLTPLHVQRRFDWAKIVRHGDQAFWQTVVFTDESKFNLFNSDGRFYVWRREGENLPQCIRERVKHPSSVNVWGSMSHQGVGDLRFVEGRMN